MKSPCSATSVTLATDEMDNVVDKQPLAAGLKIPKTGNNLKNTRKNKISARSRHKALFPAFS